MLQGVLVFLFAKSGYIRDEEEAALFQNFIICVEMLIAAAAHFYAFPYKEYAGANVGGAHSFSASLAHAVQLNDFYHDTVHQVNDSFVKHIYSSKLVCVPFVAVMSYDFVTVCPCVSRLCAL